MTITSCGQTLVQRTQPLQRSSSMKMVPFAIRSTPCCASAVPDGPVPRWQTHHISMVMAQRSPHPVQMVIARRAGCHAEQDGDIHHQVTNYAAEGHTCH